MRNGSAVLPHLAEELHEEVDDHEDRRPDGHYAEKVYDRPRIDDGEKEHHGIKGAGCAEEDRIRSGEEVCEEARDAGERPRQEVEQHELPRPHLPLDGAAEDVEAEHVGEEVPDASMDEHVGDELPVGVLMDDHAGDHGKIVFQSGEEQIRREKDEAVHGNQHSSRIRERIAELPVDYAIHYLKLSRLQ